MLKSAKDKNAYTELYEADLIDALDNYAGSIDLIIAMDVLCYFGNLTDIFNRCHKALANNGIFAFSVVKPKTDAVWELQVQGHFVHSLEHLQQVANDTGFKQIFSEELALRRELDEDQYGYVCLYQKD
jgi:predicted TPR repeat methyltransferase